MYYKRPIQVGSMSLLTNNSVYQLTGKYPKPVISKIWHIYNIYEVICTYTDWCFPLIVANNRVSIY